MMPSVANSCFAATRRPASRGRPAFTLTEMLVALAVMVLALAVVTNVFSVTTKTAATSAAIADVAALVRNFSYQIEQDLEYCDPSQSILVIHGRTQAAALTEELRQAGQYYRVLTGDPGLVTGGYDPRFGGTRPDPNDSRKQYSDPRADILMFFTNRPLVSKAPPTGIGLDPTSFEASLQRGVKALPSQIVYGHAALDTAVRSGNTWTFADVLQHIEREDGDAAALSPLSATRWHLARRVALLDPNGVVINLQYPSDQFQNNNYPRLWRCYSDDDARAADAAVYFNLAPYLRRFQPEGAPVGEDPLVLRSPYGFSPNNFLQQPSLRWANNDRDEILNVLYANGQEPYHHVATVIEQPPAALQDNLGLHLLPGCVWFQVELLLPEDPRNARDYPLSEQRHETPRWVGVEPDQTYVFVPDTPENRELLASQVYGPGSARPGRVLPLPNRLGTFAQVIPPGYSRAMNLPHDGDTADNRNVRMWPYAIRVTVRVFDQRGRLDQPIVQSVVHRFD